VLDVDHHVAFTVNMTGGPGDTAITMAVASREDSISDDAITIAGTKSMAKVRDASAAAAFSVTLTEAGTYDLVLTNSAGVIRGTQTVVVAASAVPVLPPADPAADKVHRQRGPGDRRGAPLPSRRGRRSRSGGQASQVRAASRLIQAHMNDATPTVVFDARMRSPGHRSNVLDPALTVIGVACVLDGKSSSQMAVRQAMMNADQIGL